MHYYQFNIADYRKDTGHLSPIEHYIYRELLDWMYLDECEIPKENQKVLRRLRLGSENEPELINVLNDFFKLEENGWVQDRVLEEIAAYKAKLDQLRKNGSKGGRPRKSKLEQKNEDPKKPNGLQKDSKSKPDEKVTNNHKPITNNQDIKTMFSLFWDSFPSNHGSKGSRQNAEKEFLKLKPDKPLIEKMVCAVERQAQNKNTLKSLGQFCENFQHVERWIKNRRWEDEISPVNRELRQGNGFSKSDRTKQAVEDYLNEGEDRTSMGCLAIVGACS